MVLSHRDVSNYDAAKIILENIGDWCNGSIVASEAEADGSIPSSPASLLL